MLFPDDEQYFSFHLEVYAKIVVAGVVVGPPGPIRFSSSSWTPAPHIFPAHLGRHPKAGCRAHRRTNVLPPKQVILTHCRPNRATTPGTMALDIHDPLPPCLLANTYTPAPLSNSSSNQARSIIHVSQSRVQPCSFPRPAAPGTLYKCNPQDAGFTGLQNPDRASTLQLSPSQMLNNE